MPFVNFGFTVSAGTSDARGNADANNNAPPPLPPAVSNQANQPQTQPKPNPAPAPAPATPRPPPNNPNNPCREENPQPAINTPLRMRKIVAKSKKPESVTATPKTSDELNANTISPTSQKADQNSGIQHDPNCPGCSTENAPKDPSPSDGSIQGGSSLDSERKGAPPDDLEGDPKPDSADMDVDDPPDPDASDGQIPSYSDSGRESSPVLESNGVLNSQAISKGIDSSTSSPFFAGQSSTIQMAPTGEDKRSFFRRFFSRKAPTPMPSTPKSESHSVPPNPASQLCENCRKRNLDAAFSSPSLLPEETPIKRQKSGEQLGLMNNGDGSAQQQDPDAEDASSSEETPTPTPTPTPAPPPPPPPPAPKDKRGFLVSDNKMKTNPDAAVLNKQIVDESNYIVNELEVEHTEYGKVRFIDELDLRVFGDIVDISKVVIFSRGELIIRVPIDQKGPENMLQITFYNITRDDFVKYANKTGEITDDELDNIQKEIGTNNGAVSTYNQQQKKWILITKASNTSAGGGGGGGTGN